MVLIKKVNTITKSLPVEQIECENVSERWSIILYTAASKNSSFFQLLLSYKSVCYLNKFLFYFCRQISADTDGGLAAVSMSIHRSDALVSVNFYESFDYHISSFFMTKGAFYFNSYSNRLWTILNIKTYSNFL